MLIDSPWVFHIQGTRGGGVTLWQIPRSEGGFALDKRLMEMTLAEKEEYSKQIIRDAQERFDPHMVITFTGGKDSLTMLHLAREAFGGTLPFPVLTIDTSANFREITDFIGWIWKEWGFELITVKNEKALQEIRVAEDKAECCRRLKAEALNDAITKYGWKGVFTAIRWDEQESRQDEEFFSARNKPSHTRVNPILHFREIDIWAYIKKYALPYCELYKKGYRSLDCEPCTKPHGPGGAERGGRSQDKEEAMKSLRDLGYF
jgi:phosphoadenosine phosphosulfate reductase